MYNLIQQAPIRWPQKDKHGIEVSKDARDLISRMLEKNRKDRLGQHGDVEEILNHPWFAELDMDDILKKKIEAPFVPKIESRADLQNFEDEMTGQELTESILPQESKQMIENHANAFKNFGPTSSGSSNPSSFTSDPKSRRTNDSNPKFSLSSGESDSKQ